MGKQIKEMCLLIKTATDKVGSTKIRRTRDAGRDVVEEERLKHVGAYIRDSLRIGKNVTD